MRRLSDRVGCSWLITHHRRKAGPLGVVALEEEPFVWLQEAAGSYALINHTDVRLGIELVTHKGDAELVVAGFVRHIGRSPAVYLARDYDDIGDPKDIGSSRE